MTSITKDAIGLFQLRRKRYFPYITFNLIRRYCEIGDNAYKYQSHGGWFMAVFGLLPVIWDACPFTWQVGLFNGTVLALVFNIITYILFSNKIERIEAAVATQDINTQSPAQNLSLQIMEERNKAHNYRLYSKLFVIVLGILPGIWRSCPFTWQAGLIIGIAIAIVFNIITYILFYNKIKRIAASDKIQDVVQDIITQRSSSDCPLDWNKPYFIAQINGKYVFIDSGLCVADSEPAMQSMLDEIVASDDKEEILYRTLQDIVEFMQQEKAEEIYFITNDENSQIPSRSLIAAPKNTTSSA